MSKLIRISDVIETKLRKEKELEFYREQIEKIKTKMSFLQKDLDITNIIINRKFIIRLIIIDVAHYRKRDADA